MKNNIPGKNYKIERYTLEGLCITVQIVTVFYSHCSVARGKIRNMLKKHCKISYLSRCRVK